MFKPKREVPATVEFVDIAGLGSASSKKEGSNLILAHVRDSALLAHVVRCFDDPDVPHVSNKVSPADDIELLHLELALADLETIDKRHEKLTKELKDPARKKEAERELSAYAKIRPALQDGKPARSVTLDADEVEAVRRSFLITMKRELYVCNADEEGVKSGSAHIDAVKKIAAADGVDCVVICGKFEAELADLESGRRSASSSPSSASRSRDCRPSSMEPTTCSGYALFSPRARTNAARGPSRPATRPRPRPASYTPTSRKASSRPRSTPTPTSSPSARKRPSAKPASSAKRAASMWSKMAT